MRFYQSRYLREEKFRSENEWRASPIYAPPEVLTTAQKFPTWIGAMGVDILCRESLDFGHRLRKQGCAVTVREFRHYPHMALLLQDELGMELVQEMANFIRTSFYKV